MTARMRIHGCSPGSSSRYRLQLLQREAAVAALAAVVALAVVMPPHPRQAAHRRLAVQLLQVAPHRPAAPHRQRALVAVAAADVARQRPLHLLPHHLRISNSTA